MKCSNCGSNVKEGENFCRFCGTKIISTQPNDLSTTTNNQQPQLSTEINTNANNLQSIQDSLYQEYLSRKNNNVNGDELIDSYIGKNAQEIKNNSFSICTFFFGIFYILYRKMWLLALIWVAVSVFSVMFLSSISGIINSILGIVMAINFNKLYLKHVKEKVEIIKNENSDKTVDELKIICKKKGGTSVLSVIICLIIYILIFTILFFAILGQMVKEQESLQVNSIIINNLIRNR